MTSRLFAAFAALALASSCSSPSDPEDTGATDVASDTLEDTSDTGDDGDTNDEADTTDTDTTDEDTAETDTAVEDTGPITYPEEVLAATAAYDPPACGSETYAWTALLPGPGEAGYDADFAAEAHAHDRQFRAINAYGTSGNADLVVLPDDLEARDAIRRFIEEDDSWDFETFSGLSLADTIASWGKVTGAYAGVGIAADAFRYATLRDQGAACEAVDVARQHLVDDLDLLHMASAITGVEGVIVRAVARRDFAGIDGIETVPLFDAEGNPLPEEKNNGTFRDDQSGLYPDWIWEDSCSRDQLIGWALAYASLWEVIAEDPGIDDALKLRLQADAAAIGRSLMIVGEDGYDLEIHDADGRITYHGFLHESAIDRVYLPGVVNGQNAIMALGIVAAMAYVSEDPEVQDFLSQQLLGPRALHEAIAEGLHYIDVGYQTNFSNYNMAFTGAWLSTRYLAHLPYRDTVADAVRTELYAREGRTRQPVELSWSFYDLVYAVGMAGARADAPLSLSALDTEAIARGMQTMHDFPSAPFFTVPIENCDAAELEAGVCEAVDGTEIVLLGEIGRNNDLVTESPLPITLRAHSNYYWRSNPFTSFNGTSDSGLLPAADFRFVYWASRWQRTAP